MKKCDCYHEIEQVKRLTDFEMGIEFAKTGELPQREQRYTEGVCWGTYGCKKCKCEGNRCQCDFYRDIAEEAKKEHYAEITKKAYEHLVFWARTHMTSITRYVFNENPKYDEKYRELAKNAVNEMLILLNGKGVKGYEKPKTLGEEIIESLKQAIEYEKSL